MSHASVTIGQAASQFLASPRRLIFVTCAQWSPATPSWFNQASVLAVTGSYRYQVYLAASSRIERFPKHFYA